MVGGDPDKDVAVLQLLDIPPEKMRELKPVRLGSSSTLMVGQRVYAIGARALCRIIRLAAAPAQKHLLAAKVQRQSQGSKTAMWR